MSSYQSTWSVNKDFKSFTSSLSFLGLLGCNKSSKISSIWFYE